MIDVQKVLKCTRRMSRKLSCMKADDVYVPTRGGAHGEGTSSQPPATFDAPSSSRARRDDDDDDDDDDDEEDEDWDPPQHELPQSQLADAPPPTQSQVMLLYDVPSK